jgi:hypothetical protein
LSNQITVTISVGGFSGGGFTYEWSDGVELGSDYQSLGLNFKDSSIYSVLVSSNTGSWHKTYYNYKLFVLGY